MSSSTDESFPKLNLITGSITLLLLALIMIALIMSTRRDLLETSDEYYISTYFTNIGLLQTGAPVRYRGVKIGRVTSILLQKDMRIQVVCKVILANRIPVDSKLAVAATTVSGDTYLNLIPGSTRRNLPNSDTPEHAPLLKGLNFIDISSLGLIFTDMKDIGSVFINSVSRLFGKNSYTLRKYKEFLGNIPKLKQEFAEFNAAKQQLITKISKLKPGITQIKDSAESCLQTITNSYPTAKIKSEIKAIAANIQDLSQTFSEVRNNPAIASIQNNIQNVDNWVDSLKIAKHSILGIMLSKDCGGMPRTIKMVGKAVNTVQDFSLFKKLGFYMDGKQLLSDFEKRTHAEYLPASRYMYRWSVFSYKRYLHNCDLPCGVKNCPPELK